MISPLSLTINGAFLEEEIESSILINNYKKNVGIDISKYFENISKVQIYKCSDTNYRFYFPYSLAGNKEFYEALQKFDWYYMPWKWEHQKASEYLKSDMKLLEIGCGEGSFLSRINNKVASSLGLEFNPIAIEKAKSNSVSVSNETVEKHAQEKEQYYDFVCSFQVLEHISEVYSFLDAKIKCLKKGGLLWISVPNSDSFQSMDAENDFLNFPPHHMGLWNEESLMNLEKIYQIKVKEILIEPLQSHHFVWYQFVTEKDKINTRIKSILYYHLGGRKRYAKYIKKNAHRIRGHTIGAVFYKV